MNKTGAKHIVEYEKRKEALLLRQKSETENMEKRHKIELDRFEKQFQHLKRAPKKRATRPVH